MHLIKRAKSFSPSSSSFVMVSVRPLSTVTTVRVRGVEGVGTVGVEGRGRKMGKGGVILVVMVLCEGAMITLLMLMFASAASGGRSVEPQSAAWRQVNLLSVLHQCLMIRST